MFAAIKERRLWLAALVSLLLGPVVGMLYLNRGRNALLYLAAVIAIPLIIAQILSSYGFLETLIVSISIAAVGSVHSYFIARSRSISEPIRWYATPIGLASALAVFVGIPLFVFHASNRSFYGASASMEPTVAKGDRFLVDAIAYRSIQPRRGDVIAFYAPHDSSRAIFIKRIVGLPGDRVQMIDGIVHVNGKAAQRRQVADYDEGPPECVPGDCLVPQFVESLPGSSPYRVVQRRDLLEQDNTKIFVVPAGHYFVLGDNRENSLDSRFSEIGFVPSELVVGKATMKYFDGMAHRVVWQRID